MNKSNPVIKRTPVFFAVSCALASISTSVLAEQNSNVEEVEKIQVTGSRILREGAIAPAPVTVISGESLLSSGVTNIGEALNDLPALANTYSLANGGRNIGTAGLSMLDLRGMGTARTLVLVDGKRHVGSSPGSSAVDVNNIPSNWIERVEIITGGASAVYGADAVTGVVNFILKKDIQGFDLSVSKGSAEEGPYENEKFSLSYGVDFDGGKGNVGISVSHVKQDGMTAKDRAQTRAPITSVSNPADKDYRDENGNYVHDGVPDKLTIPNGGWFDDAKEGNFYLVENDQDVWYIFNPDGSVRPQKLGTTYSDYGKCSGDCDILDLTRYTELQPTFENTNVNIKANYDITTDINAYASAKYVKSEADSIGQPSFFEYGNSRGTGAFIIKRDNAYIHESLAQLMDSKGVEQFAMHRFMEDAGRRYEFNERETTRFVVGATGVVADDWDFDVSAVYGKTETSQTNAGNTIKARVKQSADAIKLANGDIVCRDMEARAAGCVPTSLFGYGAVSDEAAAWFNTTSISESTIKQTVFNANISNSAIYELPAGYVGVSFGVEYRKEESDSLPDAFAATGATFLNAIQEEHGDFTVREAFTEISIPLLSDVLLAQDLSFDLAARFADYSTIGDTLSWKAGINWTVTDELRIRATKSQAMRAPNITELYGPQSETFFSSITDPCQKGQVQDANRRANCDALGIPVDFDAIATVSSIPGLSGGNPELKEEESDSVTYGVVYTPEAIEGFTVTLDYWKIEIDDAIDAVAGQDILDKCVDSLTGIDNQFCALITRDADGELRNIRSITQNVAKQSAEGVDFEFGYDFDLLEGRMTTSLIGTYLISRKEYPFQVDPTDFIQNAGTEGEAEWQAMLSLGYKVGNWQFGSKTRYLDEVSRYTEQELEKNPDPNSLMGYGTYFITDIRGGYSFENGITLELGVDNVFDRDLPGYTTGTGVGTASYDNIGRMYYGAITYQF
ncbi:TonB-dependent receptor [Pseudoalteromonas maricaloris]|uniref:TonB-dependent receptor n=1 Tax=Pseudoalteromonas maricaloris TaxID=184924 RepID=UPI0021ADD809|nr:TonB-dependent receptor [Pseudoalteromonas flavipulchra]USE67686.1 TonB-dependent receptor [Pseudoalteromonas flavipulchra]